MLNLIQAFMPLQTQASTEPPVPVRVPKLQVRGRDQPSRSSNNESPDSSSSRGRYREGDPGTPSQGNTSLDGYNPTSSWSPDSSPNRSRAASPETPTQKRKRKGRTSLLGGLFTTQEPSQMALKEFARQQKRLTDVKGQRAVTPGFSSQKLPKSVPKVNSKWDGMPNHFHHKEGEPWKRTQDSHSQGKTSKKVSTESSTNVTRRPSAESPTKSRTTNDANAAVASVKSPKRLRVAHSATPSDAEPPQNPIKRQMVHRTTSYEGLGHQDPRSLYRRSWSESHLPVKAFYPSPDSLDAPFVEQPVTPQQTTTLATDQMTVTSSKSSDSWTFFPIESPSSKRTSKDSRSPPPIKTTFPKPAPRPIGTQFPYDSPVVDPKPRQPLVSKFNSNELSVIESRLNNLLPVDLKPKEISAGSPIAKSRTSLDKPNPKPKAIEAASASATFGPGDDNDEFFPIHIPEPVNNDLAEAPSSYSGLELQTAYFPDTPVSPISAVSPASPTSSISPVSPVSMTFQMATVEEDKPLPPIPTSSEATSPTGSETSQNSNADGDAEWPLPPKGGGQWPLLVNVSGVETGPVSSQPPNSPSTPKQASFSGAFLAGEASELQLPRKDDNWQHRSVLMSRPKIGKDDVPPPPIPVTPPRNFSRSTPPRSPQTHSPQQSISLPKANLIASLPPNQVRQPIGPPGRAVSKGISLPSIPESDAASVLSLVIGNSKPSALEDEDDDSTPRASPSPSPSPEPDDYEMSSKDRLGLGPIKRDGGFGHTQWPVPPNNGQKDAQNQPYRSKGSSFGKLLKS